jgi:hypothetical protein
MLPRSGVSTSPTHGGEESNPLLTATKGMPYQPHDDLRSPDDPNARIWRFMDLAKFLDLIHSRQLHLRRGDSFDDPYEGMIPDELISGVADPVRRTRRNAWHAERRADYYVTCWHVSEDEPAGMWKLYGGPDGGIAVTSTYERLRQALDAVLFAPCYLGTVEYGDSPWDIDRFSSDILALMHKRKNFSHEREVRGLVRLNGAGGVGRNIDQEGREHEMPLVEPSSNKNLRIDVNVDALVAEVVLSPAVPEWWAPMITGIMKRFDLAIPVTVSELYRIKRLSGGVVESR